MQVPMIFNYLIELFRINDLLPIDGDNQKD